MLANRSRAGLICVKPLLGGVLVLARLAMAAAALAHFAHALHAFMPMLAAVPGLLRFRLRRLGLLGVLRECRGPKDNALPAATAAKI
jgi:hypothetical protein